MLLPANLSGLAPEIHCVPAGPARGAADKVPAAEDQEVQHRHHRQKICREGAGDHTQQEVSPVDIGQVFYLDGQDEEQQHLHVGKQGRKGEEHGQIDILGVQPEAQAGDEVHQEAVKNGEKNAGKKVNVKLRRAPVLLQRAADPIIEIEGDEGQQPRAGRIEHKGHKPPDLTPEDKRRVKAQIAHQHRVHRPQKPESNVGDDHIAHEVLHAKIGMLVAEALYIIHGVFHMVNLS